LQIFTANGRAARSPWYRYGVLLPGYTVLAVSVAAMAGWIVNRFLRTIGLSFFDRLLGAVFGLARGVLIAMALLTAFLAFGPLIGPGATPAAVVNSRIAPYVLEASRLFVSIAPMELKASFRKQYTQVKSAWRKDVPEERD